MQGHGDVVACCHLIGLHEYCRDTEALGLDFTSLGLINTAGLW